MAELSKAGKNGDRHEVFAITDLGLLYMTLRKFEPVTTFADSTISAAGC
jgi:hypothetical protein